MEAIHKITKIGLVMFLVSVMWFQTGAFEHVFNQQDFPAAPVKEEFIYVLNTQGVLDVLPSEAATSKLIFNKIAKSDQKGHVTLQGESSPKKVTDNNPRFYLFVSEPDHPPLLVRLTRKHGARSVDALMQRGYRGLVVPGDEIIKPHYRVLSKNGNKNYLEISPREPLEAGEYAFIGNDPASIVTFGLSSGGK